jgi:hypothetical protein
MGERRSGIAVGVVVALALFILALVLFALSLGGGGGASPAASGAVELRDGVPVGVQRTPAGALAAADNYLAYASQTLEQDPAAFALLVAQAYAPASRAQALSEAQQLRLSDSVGVSNYTQGGRGLALVAARRLDSYTPSSATVTSWLAGFVWGPHLTPRQSWNLVDTTLVWSSGRWLVVSSQTDPTPAPVPAIVYVAAGNDAAAAFSRLAGMTAPFYGSG